MSGGPLLGMTAHLRDVVAPDKRDDIGMSTTRGFFSGLPKAGVRVCDVGRVFNSGCWRIQS